MAQPPFYKAVVVNVNDHHMNGYAQIRVFGVHDDIIANYQLPYAMSLLPTTEAGTSGIGLNPGLKPTSRIIVLSIDYPLNQEFLIVGVIPTDDQRPYSEVFKSITESIGVTEQKPLLQPSQLDNTFLKGATNFEKSWNFFRGRDFNINSTAAIIGNMKYENDAKGERDLDPTREEITDRPQKGIGLFQWTFGRRDLLYTFNSNPNLHTSYSLYDGILNPVSLYGQLAYTIYEMIGTDKAVQEQAAWYKPKPKLDNVKSLEEANIIVINHLRPAGWSSDNPINAAGYTSRLNFSQQIKDQFVKSGG